MTTTGAYAEAFARNLREQSATQVESALYHDYALTFDSPHGQRVLTDIEYRSFVGKTTMTRPSPTEPIDPLETSYNEGMRAGALKIRSMYERGRAKPEPAPTKATPSLSED
jgi:hypothetical protein